MVLVRLVPGEFQLCPQIARIFPVTSGKFPDTPIKFPVPIHREFGNRGKTPGRTGSKRDGWNGIPAERLGFADAWLRMLHLRARGFAPVTEFISNLLI